MGAQVSPPSGSPTAASFFASLPERDPLIARGTGTLRFDLADDQHDVEHWYVTLRDGRAAVSHDDAPADAVVRLDRRAFEEMVAGRMNAIAATLRGQLVPEGDLGLVLLFQRLFPGPPTSTGRAAPSGSGRS